MSYQIPLLLEPTEVLETRIEPTLASPIRDRLKSLLSADLDFHNGDSARLTHAIHAFPAKFPPDLPRLFIEQLTEPGESVLDPMMGSGTTVLEASVAGRRALGNDIDPLAYRIAQAKLAKLEWESLIHALQRVVSSARRDLATSQSSLSVELATRFDEKTKTFVDYWFARQTQMELQALYRNIETVESVEERVFLEVAFSSTIITKSGGVSLALDLAHSRPHRAKRVYGQDGTLIVEDALIDPHSSRLPILTKRLRSSVDEFEKKALRNMQSAQSLPLGTQVALLSIGDSRELTIAPDSIDLVFTSPPYASNAIDYMRVNKFSLVWLGESVTDLSVHRNNYIGGEATSGMRLVELPRRSHSIVETIRATDAKRSLALHRYFTEMSGALAEMGRVTKPGKAIVLVVGNSTMRGVDTCTAECLGEIGEALGLDLVDIGVRNLDRGKRMLPSASRRSFSSGIEQRMHQEYVIGFVKR